MQKEFWRARLMDPDQTFFDQFSQPPQVLYKYMPAHRLDHALPDEKPCSFRVTPPNELNDINEINYKTAFVDDEKVREDINREYALTLTQLFPTSPISVDDVEMGIPVKWNSVSGDLEHGFRRSGTLVGA